VANSPKLGWQVVEYRMGKGGYGEVSSYDDVRYKGPTNEYKQAVMAAAYRKMLGSLKGKRVLDVGCGTGRGVVDFADEATLTVGTDASLDMLSFAAKKASGSRGCCFSASYAQELPFRSESFDVVTSLNFLHLFNHENQRQMVSEMKRVLKPNGVLVLEFDNALHGLGLGLWKRWSGRERGSLPGEIRQVLGDGCVVELVYGAVLPVVWRIFHRFPRLFLPVEKITRLPVLNRLAHRVYYKVRKSHGCAM